jgi:hypothetical protein
MIKIVISFNKKKVIFFQKKFKKTPYDLFSYGTI